METNLILQALTKQQKKSFLAKLSSGDFLLKQYVDFPQRKLNFDKLPDGLYECRATGEIKSRDEIDQMSGSYRFNIGLMADRSLIPESIELITFKLEQILDFMLIRKDSVRLTVLENEFVDDLGTVYKYEEIEKKHGTYLLDAKACEKYLQCLEASC